MFYLFGVGNCSWKIKQEMCSTLLAFFTACEEKDLLKHVEEPLLNGLFQVIKNSPEDLFAVKIEALTTVSALAQVLQNDFGKYYDHFMPIAKDLIKLCVQSSVKLPEGCEALRGKAMDCVGLLGASVSKDKFEVDARYVLDLLIGSTGAANSPVRNFYEQVSSSGMNEKSENVDAEQEVKEYIVRACCRICTTMGAAASEKIAMESAEPRFKEYLRVLAPPLVEMAKEKVDINIFDNELGMSTPEESREQNGMAKVDINVRGLGGKRVEFNTWAVQDKELSVNMIYAYSETFDEYFLPYVVQTVEIILPELISPMYSIRLSSTFAVPKLLNCLTQALHLLHSKPYAYRLSEMTDFTAARARFIDYLGKNGVSNEDLTKLGYKLAQLLFDGILTALLESLEFSLEEEDDFVNDEMDLFNEDDDDEEMLLITAESLAAVVRLSFESGGLTDNDMDKMFNPQYEQMDLTPRFVVSNDKLSELMQKLINIMRKRIEKRVKMVNVITRLGEEADVQMFDALEASDKRMNEFLDSLSEAIGCLIKAHASFLNTPRGTNLMAVFEEVCHPFAKELLASTDKLQVVPQLKAVGLFFYDDLIDFTKSSGDRYVEFCVPYMLALANHENYLVRQAACYGLGVCAEKSGPVFDQFVLRCVEELKKVIIGPKARKGSNTSATDNAISSLYKLLMNRQATLQKANVDCLELFKSLVSLMPLKTDVIEAKLVHYKLMKHLMNADEVGTKFQGEIKRILTEATSSKKGLNKETGEYDLNQAIITNETRRFVQQAGN